MPILSKGECLKMPKNNKSKIVFIEWRDDKPFEVILVKNGHRKDYDIDFTKDGDGYYHWSGGGGEIDPKWRNKGLKKLPPNVHTWKELKEHFELTEGEVLWCVVCDSFVPEDEPCQHFRWCSKCEYWTAQKNKGKSFYFYDGGALGKRCKHNISEVTNHVED